MEKVSAIYHTQPIGTLFKEEKHYNAWCPSALQFDRRLGKFVMLIYSCDAHAHTISYPYFTTIDPDTLRAEQPWPLVFRSPDGKPVESCGLCPFILLDSGEYVLITRINDRNYRVVSRDFGKSWEYTGPVQLDGLTGRVDFWGIYHGNNGRILAGYDTAHAGIAYSDDGGQNWKHVKVPLEQEGLRANEPCIVRLEGDRLMAFIRRSLSGVSGEETALLAFSDDNGETWTTARSSQCIRMNASDCTAVVHDGTLEVFALSRFPAGSELQKRTGTVGEIRHYTAPLEEARNDCFTDRGSVVASIADDPYGAGDFSTPCCAVDGQGRLLMVYFDAPHSSTVAYTESCHYFVKGTLSR